MYVIKVDISKCVNRLEFGKNSCKITTVRMERKQLALNNYFKNPKNICIYYINLDTFYTFIFIATFISFQIYSKCIAKQKFSNTH